MNSSPVKSTSNCHYNGGQLISLSVLGLLHLCPHQPFATDNKRHRLSVEQLLMCSKHFQEQYRILIGDNLCTKPIIISPFLMNCTLSAGIGEDLDVKVVYCQMAEESCDSTDVVAVLPGALSYRKVINFKEKFNKFVEYGVGGLKKEIEELYRRAFASRGKIIHHLSTY